MHIKIYVLISNLYILIKYINIINTYMRELKVAVRTLLKLGKSSLVVVLPKEWLKEVGLRSGDKVVIKQEDDGSIRIIPANLSSFETPIKSRLVINVERCTDNDLIQRLLVANYLVGNDNIVLATKNEPVSPELLRNVRDVISKLRGFEIIEQHPYMISLQCMMDATKFSMENLVGRILALLLSMSDYVKKAFDEGDQEYLKRIGFLEDELDRLYWFGVRQLLMVQKNRALAKFVGIESALHILGNRTILKVLELAGDYLVDVSNDLSRISWDELSENRDLRVKFSDLLNVIEDIISDTLKAYNGLDAFLANGILKRIDQLGKEIRDLTDKVASEIKDVRTGAFLIKSLTRLLDMAKSIGVVCEIVINRVMEDPRRLLRGCIYKEL